jgi:2-dehydropantoate 2-reductase
MSKSIFANDKAAPRYFVLGAGAIGRLWATRLKSAGAQVGFITRSMHQSITVEVNDLQYQGTQSFVFDCTHASQLNKASLDGAQLIIATKAHQATQALAELLPALTDSTRLLVLCNGVGIQQAMLELLKQNALKTALYWGVSSDGAVIHADHSLQHTGVGVTHIGCLNKATKRHNNFLLPKNFSLVVDQSENIKVAIWHKFFINCAINPATVHCNCNNGELLDNASYADFFTALCSELQRLYNNLRLSFTNEKNARSFNALQCELPESFSVQQAARQVARQTAKNTSSMLRDTRNNKVTEIAFLNGHLVKWAISNKLPCPLNRQLQQEVLQRSSDN